MLVSRGDIDDHTGKSVDQNIRDDCGDHRESERLGCLILGVDIRFNRMYNTLPNLVVLLIDEQT